MCSPLSASWRRPSAKADPKGPAALLPTPPIGIYTEEMFKAIIKFIQEARVELAKVTWPSRRTVINLTLAVLGISLMFAIFVGGVDYLFTEGIKLLTALSNKSNPTVSAPDINVSDIETSGSGVEVTQ